MKRAFTLSLSIIAISGIILLQSYSSGPAANNTRATGAPGDGVNTCVTCHNSGGPFGTINIDVEVEDGQGNPVTEYIPDATYKMTVTVNNSSGDPHGYGFQMVCLKTDGNVNVPGWSNPSDNAQLESSGGRNYVEHHEISETNVFTVDWTAPDAGTGTVKFYVGGNAVNGNGQNTGDRAALASLEMDEMETDTTDTTTGVIMLNTVAKQWSIYPNPAANVVHISGVSTNTVARVYNMHGEEILTGGFNVRSLKIEDLPRGYYFIRIDGQPGIQKFLKL